MNVNKLVLGSTGVLSGALLLASGQAVAQQSASAQAMLEEIVVTSRRREENLQDLPLSIAAMNADAMEAQGILTIEDISDFVPNVTLTTSDRANNTRVIIRGIGGGHPDPVFVFGSGMYIDGHYVPNSLGGYMSTMDIERVELLRGPQGTLFGKNVTGGAVNIISAKPGPEFESSLMLRAAEDGDQDLRAMVNFPLGDNVYARLGFASEQFDGYYYNRHLGVDTGGEDLQSFNAAIRWEPGSWTIDVNAFLIKRRDDNKGSQCSELGHAPGTADAAPSWGGFPGRVDRLYPGADQDYHDACNSDSALGPFVNSSQQITFSDIDQEAVFASAQWDSDGAVGGLDNLTMKLSGSYRFNDYDYITDRDTSFLAIDAIGEFNGTGDVGQDNWTHGFEFLLEAQASDRLQFTVGVNSFYEKAKNGDGICHQQAHDAGILDVVPGSNPPLPVNPGLSENCTSPSGLFFELLGFPLAGPGGSPAFHNTARVENESLGVFGHLTYDLSDNWILDVGARWTEDDRNYWNMEWGIVPGSCNTGVANAGDQVHLDPSTTGSTDLCRGIVLPLTFDGIVGGGFHNHAEDTFSEVTPMISLTRQLAGGNSLESGMYYFLYSEGFLTGGFNAEINVNVPAVASLASYDPEHVSNYEVGFKGTFADGRVRLMADIFYMDYQDKQDSIGIDNPPLVDGPDGIPGTPDDGNGLFGIDDPLGVVQNVSEVDIYGLELELRASPWDGGFISVDLGVLSNEYGSYKYIDPSDPNSLIDETNNAIRALTADWSLNIGLEHQFQLGSGATITPRLNAYTQDDLDYRASTVGGAASPCNQPSYTKLGARVTYVPPAANWRASLFGQNITDEEIFESCGASRGVYRYRHERPAYWGIEFSANWGG